jgi:hypothetical protein
MKVLIMDGNVWTPLTDNYVLWVAKFEDWMQLTPPEQVDLLRNTLADFKYQNINHTATVH